MKRIDRLILRDLAGPWLFGVGLFTALIMAATYLGRIAGFIVDGVPLGLVLELTGLYMPAILVKTFSMAVLLAGLLAFGRLSSDSEIVALRAAGASIYRIVAPVLWFSVLVALITFWFDEQIVPSASTRSLGIANEVARSLHPTEAKPYAQPIVQQGKLRLAIVAEKVTPATKALQGVTVVAYNEKGQETYIMFADEIENQSGDLSNMSDWRVVGNARIVSADLTQVITVPSGIWPSQLPTLKRPFAQVYAPVGDQTMDLESMGDLKRDILRHQEQGDMSAADIHNREFWYWNKLAIPLASLTFGALGAVLGIRNHRTGNATGMAIAIAIIFAFWMLVNFMNVWAEGGILPAWAASFAPLVIGAVASGVIMWRRNQ